LKLLSFIHLFFVHFSGFVYSFYLNEAGILTEKIPVEIILQDKVNTNLYVKF